MWLDQLEAFLDGELAAEETRAVERHLRECGSCSADAFGRVRLKRAVHVAGRRFSPPAALRKRIEKQMAPARRASRQRWWIPALAGTAAAAIVAAVLLVGPRSEAGFQEVADLHTTALASSSPVDVASSDRHTVKPWFQGRLPFAFNLPELAGSEFKLLGGRAAFVRQQPAAHLLFQARKHFLSVFILRDVPDAQAAFGGDSAQSRWSFQTATWAQNGLRYVVISDAGQADVNALAALLKAAGAGT
jgi:anti-sigma factor RsiW